MCTHTYNLIGQAMLTFQAVKKQRDMKGRRHTNKNKKNNNKKKRQKGPLKGEEKLPKHEEKQHLDGIAKIRKGRTWAIAVRRGSCKSLFLPNSGRFSLEKKKEIQSWTLVRVKRSKSLWPKFFPL